MVTIRHYRPADRPQVVAICHRTGYFGEDAAPYFRDAELFGLLFTAHYLEHEPRHCFVADDGGTVAGYIIGTPDTESQREAFARLTVPKIVRRAFTTTLFRHPADVWFLLSLRDHEEYERGLYSEELLSSFPAHLHMNVSPDHQRRGLGSALMARFLAHMKKEGVPGVHLVTSTENRKALPFYEKEGFVLVRELPGKLWETKSPPGVRALVFARSLR
jgi:ribosomal protein S18 acetylase RimI-like enzyme